MTLSLQAEENLEHVLAEELMGPLSACSMNGYLKYSCSPVKRHGSICQMNGLHRYFQVGKLLLCQSSCHDILLM